jgi:hypothetical protein
MVYLVGVVPQVSLVEGAARVAHGHPQRRRRAASGAAALDGAEGAHDGLRGAAGWECDALQGVRE